MNLLYGEFVCVLPRVQWVDVTYTSINHLRKIVEKSNERSGEGYE